MNGTDPFNYTLVFSYHPMSQIELVVEFALPWEVYIIIYLIICVASVFMILIMLIYHYILSRERPRPPLRFWKFIQYGYPKIVLGMLLSLIPIYVIQILNEIIMLHQFQSVSINSDIVCTQKKNEDCYSVF